jgi:hypothetical protein
LPGWSASGLAVVTPPVETAPRGPLPDQAALLRLLARLECFRARMTEVRRVRDTGR